MKVLVSLSKQQHPSQRQIAYRHIQILCQWSGFATIHNFLLWISEYALHVCGFVNSSSIIHTRCAFVCSLGFSAYALGKSEIASGMAIEFRYRSWFRILYNHTESPKHYFYPDSLLKLNNWKIKTLSKSRFGVNVCSFHLSFDALFVQLNGIVTLRKIWNRNCMLIGFHFAF